MPSISKAEFESLKSSITQAERSRDALAQRVAKAETAVGRLTDDDREDCETLAHTIESVCDALGFDNPLKRDFSELRDEWNDTYEKLDALYWAVSEARSKVEDALCMIDDYDSDPSYYEPKEIEDEFEAAYDEYYNVIDEARRNW